jgi:hypothetical protein
MNTFTPTKLYQNYEAILLKRQLFLVAISFFGAISFAQVPSIIMEPLLKQAYFEIEPCHFNSSNTINLSYTPGYGMQTNRLRPD